MCVGGGGEGGEGAPLPFWPKSMIRIAVLLSGSFIKCLTLPQNSYLESFTKVCPFFLENVDSPLYTARGGSLAPGRPHLSSETRHWGRGVPMSHVDYKKG